MAFNLLRVALFTISILTAYFAYANVDILQVWMKPTVSGPRYVARLEEVTAIMDEIYTTLAKMTYIPETAIKRGPHKIDRDLAIKAKRSEEIIALMEMLPYIDHQEINDPAWLYGGLFTDYRKVEFTDDINDPVLTGLEEGEYMSPWTLALTARGEKQSILFYDVRKHRVRLYCVDCWEVHDLDYKFYKNPDENNELHDPNIFDNLPSFEATAFLKEILRRFRELELIPWGAVWGQMHDEAYKAALKKNGWPDHFDAKRFNIDMIRHHAKPSGKGWAEEDLKFIDRMEKPYYSNGANWIESEKAKILEKETQFKSTIDPHEKSKLDWQLKLQKHYLQETEDKLQEARDNVKRLCPDGVCVKDEDLILWEARNIDREYEYFQRWANEAGERSLQYNSPEEREKLENILELKLREFGWMMRAYVEIQTEMDVHCRKNGLKPLPKDDERARAIDMNERSRKGVDVARKRIELLKSWREDIPLEAPTSLQMIDEEIAREQSGIDMADARIKQTVAWYEEQGNPL